MKFTFTLIFSLAFILYPIVSLCQRDYIITDTSTNTGITLLDGGAILNGQFIEQFINDTTLLYTPEHCREYGFKDGRVWISKTITLADTPRQVFLEQLVKGKLSLYYYETENSKSFFLEKDNGSVIRQVIPEGSKRVSQLPESINNLTSDCDGFAEIAEDAHYKRNSFSRLILKYNECDIRPFPHFRFGPRTGIGLHKIEPTQEVLEANNIPFDFKYESGWLFGAFFDFPLSASQFSIHVAPQYQDLHYTYTVSSELEDNDLLVNATSIQLPLTFRYTFPFRRLRPMVDAGGVMSYHFTYETTVYRSMITDSLVVIQYPNYPGWIGEWMAGYVIDLGLEYDLNLKHSIFLEIRLMKEYILQSGPANKNAHIQFTIGYNL